MIVVREKVVNAAYAAAGLALAGQTVCNPYPCWSGAAVLWDQAFQQAISERDMVA